MGKKFKNKDLAVRLGVSGTLVSLVLNNKADLHGIKKDTQEKVLMMARQMGYFNNTSDQNEPLPVEQKPGIIGMVVPSLSDPFVADIVPFLHKAFESIGIGFSIITKDTDDMRFERMVGAFKKFFSGLILVSDAADDYTIRTLKTSDYPFVLLEKSVKTAKFNTVSTEMTTGVTMVTDHLFKFGYKNILIVTSRFYYHVDKPVIHDIFQAFSQNDSVSKPVVIELDRHFSDRDADFSKIEDFLRPPFRADAVIILHSELVYSLMSFFRKKNLRIPQDIALVSMEDGAGLDIMFTPVTCLRKQLPAMSLKVANMIWSEIKNSGKSNFKRQVTFAPELIIRNSCGTI